jgi:hypothetical protein
VVNITVRLLCFQKRHPVPIMVKKKLPKAGEFKYTLLFIHSILRWVWWGVSTTVRDDVTLCFRMVLSRTP